MGEKIYSCPCVSCQGVRYRIENERLRAWAEDEQRKRHQAEEDRMKARSEIERLQGLLKAAKVAEPCKEVLIDYTNWRGERAMRRIVPTSLIFQNNEWHRDVQWMLEAMDVDKDELRCFALEGIHSWKRMP